MACSPLPAASLTQSPVKVKVLCSIACVLPLSWAPPTATRFTSLLTACAPSPLLPTFPDPHLQPCPPPFEQQTEEAYSYCWSACFSFGLSPTTLGLWIRTCLKSHCAVSFSLIITCSVSKIKHAVSCQSLNVFN